jgi:hypothetical protein
MYNLGVMYENGTGVQRDYEKAISCYRKAAELGEQYAIERLKALEKE